MAKAEKESSWKDIKTSIDQLDKAQLTDLLRDVYRLGPENKDFFHTRFATIAEDPLPRYKGIIQRAIHPYLENKRRISPQPKSVKLCWRIEL